MKKLFVICMTVALCMGLCACSSSSMSITSNGDTCEIEVSNASNGYNGESPAFELSAGEKLQVTADLKEGMMKLAFAEAELKADDEFVAGDVITSVTVAEKESVSVDELEAGTYIILITTDGDKTEGSVKVTITK